ncbi:MAG TPA: HTTM domain-containing protein [Polyangiaceae bacterium]|nr:HTTM domain-containing protein [Polyangiaceae bacterium]HYQ29810.1 HTTM domain-containing protein [Polyangiaceae bacterium]
MRALRLACWRFFHEERDALVLGLLRLSISALLFFNGLRLIVELSRDGYFGEYFHIPMIPEAWVPDRSGYRSLLGLQALASLFAFLGIWPREALLTASSLGLYFLLSDRLQYHNNRYALLLLGFLLAFTPCDRSFLLVRGRAHTLPREQRIAPTFARRLFQIQVSLIYLGSLGGKLLDSDWRSGLVLSMRFAKAPEISALKGHPLPSWVIAVLTAGWFASLAAKAAIASELFIALGSWFERTRRLALWLGVVFHISIELTANVELFSWLMLSSYFSFVVPEVRERRFEFVRGSARAERLARLVKWFDWCARFEQCPLPSSPVGPTFYVTNREGRRASGVLGLSQLAEAIPLLFPLWLPLALSARLGEKREGVRTSSA